MFEVSIYIQKTCYSDKIRKDRLYSVFICIKNIYDVSSKPKFNRNFFPKLSPNALVRELHYTLNRHIFINGKLKSINSS